MSDFRSAFDLGIPDSNNRAFARHIPIVGRLGLRGASTICARGHDISYRRLPLIACGTAGIQVPATIVLSLAAYMSCINVCRIDIRHPASTGDGLAAI